MPVLVIAVLCLVLFLIMGAMCLSAVVSEHRFARSLENYEQATGLNPEQPTVRVSSAAAGRR